MHNICISCKEHSQYSEKLSEFPAVETDRSAFSISDSVKVATVDMLLPTKPKNAPTYLLIQTRHNTVSYENWQRESKIQRPVENTENDSKENLMLVTAGQKVQISVTSEFWGPR